MPGSSSRTGSDSTTSSIGFSTRTARRRRVLTLGDGIPTVSVDGEANPHFWLDPTLVRDRLPAGHRGATVGARPGRRRRRTDANAAAYARQLDALDAELMAKVGVDPGRRTASSSRSMTRSRTSPGTSASSSSGSSWRTSARSRPRPTWPRSSTRSRRPQSRRSSARRSSARSWPRRWPTRPASRSRHDLYNDALGPAPADTYLGMMRWNVDQIVAALK